MVHSSIGRKAMVAVAGLLLCGFLVTHLAGNLLLLVGEAQFNAYAEALEHNPLIVPAEIVLAALFLIHALTAIRLKLQNAAARPVGYELKRSKGGSTWGSSSMAVSGMLLLIFLVVHIKTFKFGDKAAGLYHLVKISFANPAYSFFYVAAMLGLGLHLSHGAQSAFQTLGVSHPRWTPLIKAGGWLFALAITGGFAMLPIWGLATAP